AQLALGSATVHAIEMVGLANRPYPPANVKINGEYWPDLVRGNINLSWAHRNRLQQTGGDFIGWFEAGVVLELGVTYQINLYNANNEVQVSKTTASNSIVIDQEEFTALNVRLEIVALRDGFQCVQKFEHSFVVESALNQLKFTDNYVRPVGNNVILKFKD
ncbi:MAG: hypothetical protein L0G98_15550, partial [Acinetobacter sp.]|nr:hypothetical protein [Acinetobacter sp.]